MKTALAALFLLALVPFSASAESDYRACMKTEALMGTPGAFSSVRGRFNSGSYMYRGGTFGNYGAGRLRHDGLGTSYSFLESAGSGLGSSSSWAFAQNSRVLNRSYACRHLIGMDPPAYRITGMKSPTNRTSTNVTGRTATPRSPRSFLPPRN